MLSDVWEALVSLFGVPAYATWLATPHALQRASSTAPWAHSWCQPMAKTAAEEAFVTESRAVLLHAALGFLSLESRASELRLLHECFDTWRGIGDASTHERRAPSSRGRNDAASVYGARLVSAERGDRRSGVLGNTAFREADAIRWNSLLSESVFAPTWAPHTLQA